MINPAGNKGIYGVVHFKNRAIAIVPLDEEAIVASLRKTGRLVTVEESRLRGGLGAEIAALACSKHFSLLKAPVQRVGAPMIPVPGSPHLERLYLPNKDAIVKSIKHIM